MRIPRRQHWWRTIPELGGLRQWRSLLSNL
ncbi:hypothetical protein [Paraburkholderia aspalathi]